MQHAPSRPAVARPRPLRALVPATRRCCCTRSLHLTGYDAAAGRLKHFRQLELADAPGTPSTATRPGVETTTGPLGQGIATAVGMALAERMLAARFNRAGHEVVDHRTYFIASDGDMKEGVASRGGVARRPPRARQADRLLRRQPHHDRGRHRARVLRGRRRALRGVRLARPAPRRGHRPRPRSTGRSRRRRPSTDRPSLIIARTHIAPARRTSRTPPRRTARRSARRRSGSPRRSTAGPSEEPFFVPDEVLEHFRGGRRARRARRRPSGSERVRRPTRRAIPSAAAELERMHAPRAARRAAATTCRRRARTQA